MIILRDNAGFVFIDPAEIVEIRQAGSTGAVRLKDQTSWRYVREAADTIAILKQWWSTRPMDDPAIYAVICVAGVPFWKRTV